MLVMRKSVIQLAIGLVLGLASRSSRPARCSRCSIT